MTLLSLRRYAVSAAISTACANDGLGSAILCLWGFAVRFTITGRLVENGKALAYACAGTRAALEWARYLIDSCLCVRGHKADRERRANKPTGCQRICATWVARCRSGARQWRNTRIKIAVTVAGCTHVWRPLLTLARREVTLIRGCGALSLTLARWRGSGALLCSVQPVPFVQTKQLPLSRR